MVLSILNSPIQKLSETTANMALDRIYQLLRELDDKYYTGTVAPSNPTTGMLWYKTDESDNIALRIYNGSTWRVIPLMEME